MGQTVNVDVTIRTIDGEDWPLWRSLRLRALADSPDAFRATLEEEINRPHEWWADRIGATVEHPRGGLWVAEIDGEAAGMLFGRIDSELRVLTIGAMWVSPHVRRLGIGDGLLQAALAWARQEGVGRAELWATEGNAIAQSFYTRAGFRPTPETQPLRQGSHLVVHRLISDL